MDSNEQRAEFWARLKDCRTGLLEADGRPMPMTHNLDPQDGNIWFLTAKGTDMADAAARGDTVRYMICSDQAALYGVVEGKLQTSTDRQKLDEVWSVIASAWYDEGKDDPDLVLAWLAPASAEVWLGPKSGLKFLWSVAKAKMSSEEPDYGEHFTLTF